jgi:hypothetical protein
MSPFPFVRPNLGFPPGRPPTYNPAIHAGLCFALNQPVVNCPGDSGAVRRTAGLRSYPTYDFRKRSVGRATVVGTIASAGELAG